MDGCYRQKSSVSNMGRFKPVTHVIFDMDGLLLNTEILYTKAISSITEKFGIPYPWEVKVKAMGKTSIESAKTIIEELDLPITIDEYLKCMDEAARDLYSQAELLPGVDKLTKHLYTNDVPIAIATSSKRSTFVLKMEHHNEFLSRFRHVVCGSDDSEVKAGKPAPDTFQVCASRFEDIPSPDKVLVFEDAPNGVEAAVAAGMQVVMIPDIRLDPKFHSQATLVLKSMEDFKPELFGLPPYPG